MARGFNHPELGYWQTEDDVTDEIIASYPEGTVEVPVKPGRNYTLEDGEWVAAIDEAPANPADYPLKPYQFHAMLDIAEVSQAVEDAIAAIVDPATKAVAKARMKHSTDFDRNDDFIVSLAPVVGLSPEQVDALWLQAKDL